MNTSQLVEWEVWSPLYRARRMSLPHISSEVFAKTTLCGAPLPKQWYVSGVEVDHEMVCKRCYKRNGRC